MRPNIGDSMHKFLLSLVVAGLHFIPAAAVADDDIFVSQNIGDSVVISNIPTGEGFILLVASPRDGSVGHGNVIEPNSEDSEGGFKGSLLERARRYGPWIAEAARDSNVEANLLYAVIAAESAYNPAALSSKGAIGFMQLLPETARRYGVADIHDTRQNIRGGARYLADLLRLFNNDTRLALAAYNAGENAVLRYGGKVPPFRETEAYVPRVMRFYRRFAASSL